jgi:hypothetical protein
MTMSAGQLPFRQPKVLFYMCQRYHLPVSQMLIFAAMILAEARSSPRFRRPRQVRQRAPIATTVGTPRMLTRAGDKVSGKNILQR